MHSILKTLVIGYYLVLLLPSCSGDRIAHEGNFAGREKTFEIAIKGRHSPSQSVLIDLGGRFDGEPCSISIKNIGPGSLVTSVVFDEVDTPAGRMQKLEVGEEAVVYDGTVERMGFALGNMGEHVRKIQVKVTMKKLKPIAGRIRARVLWADCP